MLVTFLYNCSRILLKYTGSIGIWGELLPSNKDATSFGRVNALHAPMSSWKFKAIILEYWL